MAKKHAPEIRKIEFRVIAGSLKGKKIVAPDLGVTRPPLTRLRRSIFDFLTPYLSGSSYLDLYSGTGSYLFEAISRGAEKALGVDRESALADSINKQASAFGISSSLTCLCQDVLQAIPQLSAQRRRFDIIMMAPPQYVGLIDQTLKVLAKHPLTSNEGLVICQHDSSETDDINWLDFTIQQQRRYGHTTFTILRV